MSETTRQIFSRPVRQVHAVGVGGTGVGPLAVYLARLGLAVTGEDDALSPEMRAQLERAGVALAPLPPECDLLVHSAAVAETHPARRAAAERAVPQVRRGELLAELVRAGKLVAVCGAHGKTTTTAMLITALRAARFPCGYVLGGLLADGSPPAEAAHDSEWIVAEIDESDGTIAQFSPEITIGVSLDWDHADFYRTADDAQAAFVALFERTRGTVLVSRAELEELRARHEQWAPPGDGNAAEATRPRFRSFGAEGDFRGNVVAEAGGSFTLKLAGEFSFSFAEAPVRARGEFNARNATAALAAAQLMGAAPSADALARFAGVRRRQSVLHRSDALTVLEDYAHHPTEIRALLMSLRTPELGSAARLETEPHDSPLAPVRSNRLVVVFQPHRFSRTAQFKRAFAAALTRADSIHVLDVYAAGEQSIPGGTTPDLLAHLNQVAPTLPVSYAAGDEEETLRRLSRDLRRGDTLVFLGAGDVDRLARRWLATARWDDFVAELAGKLSADTKLVREEPLAAKTTLRVGGAARLYAEPASVADLQVLLRAAVQRAVPVFMLGRGSNLLVPDEGVAGLVISLAHPVWAAFEPRGDGRVWAGAGLRLKNLCGLAAKAGLVGFEFLEGIPGNLGGALRMNAGAMGGWMFDVVEEVQLITLDGDVRTLPKAALHVAYRECAELSQAVALGALLRPAAQSEAEAISRQIDVYRRKRHETQPREPSAGCVFKNPPGTSAGKLIDESGLKGARVGDAEVSPVHANFIVNRGEARASEVLALVRRVRARVREAKGIELQPEVLLFGRAWEDVLGEVES
jgi:UDP-N-acetylenolpyruvoylglucosamine reductase